MAKIVLFCCMLQFAFVSGQNKTAFEAPKPLSVYEKDGIKVPAYDFRSLEYFLNKKTDTTYVVNFWATWCGPCVAELPYFEKLAADYKNRKVQVLLISLDMKKKIESHLIPFIKKKDIKSKVIFLDDPNADNWIGKVDASWSGALPATIIFNSSDRKFYEQSFTFEALEKELKQFIQ